MLAREIAKLVDGTADAAFANDASGLISAWNKAAEELFGLISAEAIGRACHEIVQGTHESGVVCSEHCAIQQAVGTNCPVTNFDLQVQTRTGTQWCNISVLIVTEPGSGGRHAVHIVRPAENQKRLELLVHDFVARETELEREMGVLSRSSTRTGSTNLKLSRRENEVLRMLAKGTSSKEIASRLYISRATVSNHIRHILTKLDAHSRLEAVRRAEHAGLI